MLFFAQASHAISAITTYYVCATSFPLFILFVTLPIPTNLHSSCIIHNIHCHFASVSAYHIQYALTGHTCKYAANYTHTNLKHSLHLRMPGRVSGGTSTLTTLICSTPTECRYLPSYSNLTISTHLLPIPLFTHNPNYHYVPSLTFL